MDAAILALTAASASCTRALDAALDAGHDTDSPTQLALILNDVDAHLARIYFDATKLALVFKPPYLASIPLLDDLAQHPPALAHCIRLLRDDAHGATLAKDVRSRVTVIIDALRALLLSFCDDTASSEEHLVRTAALHEYITDSRSPSGIPKDNQAAVFRAWESDRESLEDNLDEIKTLIKDAQSDQADDGWDDIGLGHIPRLDEHELARVNNACAPSTSNRPRLTLFQIHRLLRLTTLFHKRISLDLLAHPSPAPVTAFDNLLLQSNRLLSTSDDLVAALHIPPHDTADVRTRMFELTEIVTSLQTQLPDFLSNVPDVPGKKKPDKKWFDTCVQLILGLCTENST